MLANNYSSKKLSPVMDLDYDLSCALHTPEILEAKIRMLAENGFKRLHIVAPPPGNPDYSHAARVLPGDGPPNFLRQSRAALGEYPLELAVGFAKRAGLEVIIVFKPYEGGGVFTIPHGIMPDCGQNYMESLGGRAIGLDPFILEHPEFLLERKPYAELSSDSITKIELVFITEQVGAEEKFCSLFPAENFQIYTSFDNGKYEPYNSSVEIEEHIELRVVKNANGESVFPQPVRCRIITISGVKLDVPYFAVKFDGDKKAFRTIPFSMCAVFSGDAKVPVTVSPTARHNVWGEALFYENGFEFEEVGPYYWDCGWRSCTLFGFARGKLKRLRGSLCEAYPEVREYWLKLIKYYIALGIDGIEIRLQSHCSGVTDFVNFGFNQPLVDAYFKEYGTDILTGAADPLKLMRVRGNFFELFIKDAKALLAHFGCKLLIQLHAYMERPTLNTSFYEMGFWANPKILPSWKKLVEFADEVVIKDYNFGVYRRDEANEIKDFARKINKPLWIHCYLQQGHDWNPAFIEAVENDPRLTGMLLYEVVWNDRENDGIIEVKDDKLTWKLKEIKSSHGFMNKGEPAAVPNMV